VDSGPVVGVPNPLTTGGGGVLLSLYNMIIIVITKATSADAKINIAAAAI
jgi:hypothetical protein